MKDMNKKGMTRERKKTKKVVGGWTVDIKSPIRRDRKSCLSFCYEKKYKYRVQDHKKHKRMSVKLESNVQQRERH